VRVTRWLIGGVGALVLGTSGVLVTRVLSTHPGGPPVCLVGSPGSGYYLDPEQAENAATIAAVGRRSGLPSHAVTIALATALQESKLRNLDHGDRDSLGLFQQRPSQGWGRPAQLLTPTYAAGSFYERLRKIRGWQQLSVADAAQRVQLSADGSAYSDWEDQARTLARALTGEVAAGIGCRFDDPAAPQASGLVRAARAEIGQAGLSTAAMSEANAWRTASWLVSHARQYGVVRVSLRGRTWTSTSGRWRADASATPTLRYRFGPIRAT